MWQGVVERRVGVAGGGGAGVGAACGLTVRGSFGEGHVDRGGCEGV